MSAEHVSILVLVALFVVATVLPVNLGALAFVAAFLVGTLAAGMVTDDILGAFPADLFIILVGITYLFAIATNNGTVAWLVWASVRLVRGRVVAIPLVVFTLSALLTAVGAPAPAVAAVIAPIAFGFVTRCGINPLLIGLMVAHGTQAGAFSPISVLGGIVNGVVDRTNLSSNDLVLFFGSFAFNSAAAIIVFFVFGGPSLLGRRDEGVPAGPDSREAAASERSTAGGAGSGTSGSAADDTGAPAGVSTAGSSTAGSSTAGSSTAEDSTGQGSTAKASGAEGAGGAAVATAPGATATTSKEPPGEPPGEPPAEPGTDSLRLTLHQALTLTGILALCVAVLVFDLDVGLVAITVAVGLVLLSSKAQRGAVEKIAWPTVLLITGVVTYVGVMEEIGTIDYVGNSIAGIGLPLLAALLICYLGGIVSAFASTVGILGALVPLAVPFLQQGNLGAVGMIAALAIASSIVDVSPFSTTGALLVANARGIDRTVFYRRLLAYGATIVAVGPLAAWLVLVVPGWL